MEGFVKDLLVGEWLIKVWRRVKIKLNFYLEHERRWRNSIDHCKCADNYSGENCETIISCQNGEFINEK